MSGDPEQEYFADGLVEDIITALSRVNSFFVIARNSSFTYKGRAVDVRQVARELGVRYVLEGSIRKAGSRVRIVGQLVDAISGHHVWADRFEGDVSDIFDLQDKVTESVVGAVEPSIRLEEIRQARIKPTNYISAYDLYLRALPRFYSMTREGFADVRRLTNEALEHRPRLRPGEGAGRLYSQHLGEPVLARARRYPRRRAHGARGAGGSARRPDQPALRRAGDRLQRQGLRDGAGRDRTLPATSTPIRRRAIPAAAGSTHIPAARSSRSSTFHRAMRLSPVDPEKGIALSGIGMSYLMLERYEEALAWGERALREMPNYGSSHRVVIAALVGLNRLDEAQAAARRLMEAFPTYSLTLQRQINPWRDKVFAERYVEALGIAGVPE